jgi:hypothetical protein
MGYNYSLEEARSRLRDRRQALRAAWKAIDAILPSDTRSESAPNAKKLLLQAVELRSAYMDYGHDATEELIDGDNILMRGSRDSTRG